MGNGKIDCRPCFEKVEVQLRFVCCFVEAKFSEWNFFKLASYGKFGSSIPDLDGHNLAKGTYVLSE